VLEVMKKKWPSGFKASDVAYHVGSAETDSIEFKAALEQASGKMIPIVTATMITWRLKAIVDAPVAIDGKILALRYAAERGHGGTYQVREV
jgi:hypothetical protein